MAFDWIEIVGACTGITYLILEIRQNMWLWPVGLLNALFYAVIFFSGGLYAIMSLQLYYVAMMIYGWWNWMHGVSDSEAEQIPISHASGKIWLLIILAGLILWVAISFLLYYLTDSKVPVWDGMTTAFSIVGTWMLAKKYIEQWFVWIFVNIFSVCLYASQNLKITAVLYGVYAVMAVVGYFEWKKTICQE